MESDKHNHIFSHWEEVIQSWLVQPKDERLKLLEVFPLLFDPIQKAARGPVVIYTDIMQSFNEFENEKLRVLAETPELYKALTGLSAAIVRQDDLVEALF